MFGDKERAVSTIDLENRAKKYFNETVIQVAALKEANQIRVVCPEKQEWYIGEAIDDNKELVLFPNPICTNPFELERGELSFGFTRNKYYASFFDMEGYYYNISYQDSNRPLLIQKYIWDSNNNVWKKENLEPDTYGRNCLIGNIFFALYMAEKNILKFTQSPKYEQTSSATYYNRFSSITFRSLSEEELLSQEQCWQKQYYPHYYSLRVQQHQGRVL